MGKFIGSLKDLSHLLDQLQLEGKWAEQPCYVWTFRCSNGAGLHWSETRRTLWFDGPQKAKAPLESNVLAMLARSEKLVASKRGVRLPVTPMPSLTPSSPGQIAASLLKRRAEDFDAADDTHQHAIKWEVRNG